MKRLLSPPSKLPRGSRRKRSRTTRTGMTTSTMYKSGRPILPPRQRNNCCPWTRGGLLAFLSLTSPRSFIRTLEPSDPRRGGLPANACTFPMPFDIGLSKLHTSSWDMPASRPLHTFAGREFTCSGWSQRSTESFSTATRVR